MTDQLKAFTQSVEHAEKNHNYRICMEMDVAREMLEQWKANNIPESMVLVMKPTLLAKGEPMPQTIDAWHVLADGYERVMLKDKETISQLKQQVNNLQQKLKAKGE